MIFSGVDSLCPWLHPSNYHVFIISHYTGQIDDHEVPEMSANAGIPSSSSCRGKFKVIKIILKINK